MTEELERECLRKIEEGSLDFFQLAQKYKLEILSSKKLSKDTDSILSYFLLFLLSSGNTRRYSLNRAEISTIVESADFSSKDAINIAQDGSSAGNNKFSWPSIKTIDHLWKSSHLGDIPQMKQALSTLPCTHQELGNKAYCVLQEKPSVKSSSRLQGKGSKIEQIIKASNMFFRV